MLIATWVLAIATAILAVSGPIAIIQWRSNRHRDYARDQRERDDVARRVALDRERRQREHEDEMRKGILKDVGDQQRSWATGTAAVLGLLGLIAWSDRQDRRNDKRGKRRT